MNKRTDESLPMPPDPDNCNDMRVASAAEALSAFAAQPGTPLEDDETIISDLLTNLRHYCDRLALDFAALDQRAQRHYDAETGGPE